MTELDEAMGTQVATEPFDDVLGAQSGSMQLAAFELIASGKGRTGGQQLAVTAVVEPCFLGLR